MKKLAFLILFTLISTSVSADCWFGCDSIVRDRSTDRAKLRELLGQENLVKKDGDKEFYCSMNSKNELMTAVVELKYDYLLTVNVQAFSPPQPGESDWKRKDPSLSNFLRTMKTLNFGVAGIADELSSDKRCRAGTLRWGGSQGPATQTFVCNYNEDADLPISDRRLKSANDAFQGYSFCE